ncbi:transcription factor [Fusarium langsethiae]|uniref:Transcription factor n=1 Tax=Fusarium langsethiae TaxID=179993 RepID=A0A0N0DAT1_FUSLA|nr:transcription factor [Fusarium langsethiae]GKU15938.1 unnamed protein product [Fusarium langsethiae]
MYAGPSGFGRLHNHFQFQSPADIDGNSLKKKLDETLPFGRSPPQLLPSAWVNELISCGILGSSTGLTETPVHSSISHRSAPFPHRDRSPNGSFDIDYSLRTRLKRNNSDDAYMPDGQKRRAASPNDDHPAMPSDMSHRREMNSHGSPQGRFTSLPRGATMPLVPTSRNNSHFLTMSMSMHPASITTVNSFGRRSPVGPSLGSISPTSLNPSPRTSISRRGSIHSRTALGASTLRITEVQKPGGAKAQGFFMCECCPKKPKRFESPEELNAHEAEKQYECSFCGNRFKNKNEAERHQNSLHVRRHSWSCSALSGYDGAFHDSTNRPGEADTCGYCGDEFVRSSRGPSTGALNGGNAPRHATDRDWDGRIRHLQEVHKFRECNSSKKFFRADHFRQHLRHSHAGTSGKWTNMLENACMLEEDPTPR